MVVLLAPRDGAANLLGHFFSQAKFCATAPASASFAALQRHREISVVRSRSEYVTRQNSSRGARMTTLRRL